MNTLPLKKSQVFPIRGIGSLPGQNYVRDMLHSNKHLHSGSRSKNATIAYRSLTTLNSGYSFFQGMLVVGPGYPGNYWSSIHTNLSG
jgi:hypothetical protein